MSVVGIDLGTTNTVCAAFVGDELRIFADDEGRRGLPSVVSFLPTGQILVGKKAKDRRWQDPRNTVLSHKRFIGRPWASPELEMGRKTTAWEMREGPSGSTMVHARGKDYTLPEISAFVLKRSLEIAAKNLGAAPTQAVITVPAHFNELQRASTKIAGRVSGVDVLRILNEPTAAALAYGLAEANGQRICVYDFGGGTFDCTILDVHDNVFEVVGTSGDTFLGGDDIDELIAHKMADTLLMTHRYDARADRMTFERLKAASEEVKIALSTQEAARLTVREIAIGVGGKALDLEFRITRAEFDQLIGPLVERSIKVTEESLKLAELAPSALDKIILVGGSTRIPYVHKRLGQFFGRPPMCTLNPDDVVAMGAAISAASLSAGTRRNIPAPLASVTVRQTQVGGAQLGPGSLPAPELIPIDEEPPVHLAYSGQPIIPLPQGPSIPLGVDESIPEMRGEFDFDEPPPPPSLMPPATTRGHPGMAPGAAPPPSVKAPVAPKAKAAFKKAGVPAPAQRGPVAVPFEPAPAMRGRGGASNAVLVDVTPRALVVEVAGGFCDTIIPRNAKIPCAMRRTFSTAQDGQTVVRIRVAQGEVAQFAANTFLGEVELSGIPAAARGSVGLEVTFQLDQDGRLRVLARDTATGRAANAVIQLVGGVADEAQIMAMQQRMAGTKIEGGAPS